MKIEYFERVTKEAYLADIMELLSLCDQEFIHPLSARETIKHPKKLCLLCGLFALSLLGVFQALPYPWAL